MGWGWTMISTVDTALKMKSLILIFVLLTQASCFAMANSPLAERVCRDSWCYYQEPIEGWNVFYSEELYNGDKAVFANARQQLITDLKQITSIIPAQKIEPLKKIRIHLDLKDVGNRYFFGVYHWSKEVLIERGQDPGKFQSIEIFGADKYPLWTKSQPAAVLHELAHAYSAQFLTDKERTRIERAYDAAMAKGLYGEVPYFDGEKTYLQKAYASTDRFEYFTESVEAYFWKNDYFPFNRQELKTYDSQMYEVLRSIWQD